MLKILAKQERQQLFAGKNAFQGRRQWQKKTQNISADNLINALFISEGHSVRLYTRCSSKLQVPKKPSKPKYMIIYHCCIHNHYS